MSPDAHSCFIEGMQNVLALGALIVALCSCGGGGGGGNAGAAAPAPPTDEAILGAKIENRFYEFGALYYEDGGQVFATPASAATLSYDAVTNSVSITIDYISPNSGQIMTVPGWMIPVVDQGIEYVIAEFVLPDNNGIGWSYANIADEGERQIALIMDAVAIGRDPTRQFPIGLSVTQQPFYTQLENDGVDAACVGAVEGLVVE